MLRDHTPGAAGLSGERKQVTVVFADVKGSMDLAEQVDPEKWRAIMQRFFDLLCEGVQEFGGTVDKFTGDGIMAVFGAPVAQEDHAQRACYAALRMGELARDYAADLRRTLGLSFATRIGINSGEVVAGEIGPEGSRDYTAIGHTVGLAQRMEALAEPGSVFVAEATERLAHGYLDLADLGEFEVKGASQPVRVFELRGIGAARSRLDLSRERGFSRFVGRAREMEILEQALTDADEGRGCVIGIVADAGVGKSRLCHEFAERCRARAIDVYDAQCQPHGEAIPLMPVLQMMRGYFGIEEDEDERLAREKVAGRALLLDPAFNDDLPLIFDFLGIPDPKRPPPQMSAEARQRGLQGVVQHLMRAPNRDSTAINLVEDLHWIDEGSDGFLAAQIAAVGGTRTLLIANFRPEYTADWQRSEVYRGVFLVPLTPADTKELFEDLAGTDPSLDGMAELLHERTGGNPFFVEEVVRELVENGHLNGERGTYRLVGSIEQIRVPASVQAVLAARIDRLPEHAKRVLQAASVIDTDVPQPTLERVAGATSSGELEGPLKDLITAGFLYEAELYPERVLAFRHPLTREVAYNSQLAEQRAATHLATARAMIEFDVDRHDELAALVAQHFEQGGDTLEAARWNARAAYWTGHNQPHEALRLWGKVTELADQLSDSEESIALRITSRALQLDFAWRLGMETERSDALLEDARELATRVGDLRSLSLLEMVGPARAGQVLDGSTWIAATERAIALADQSGDHALRVAIRVAAAYAPMCAGRLDVCERRLDQALELAGDDVTAGAGIVISCPVAWAHMAKGIIRRNQNRLDEAEELIRYALELAGEQGDVETESWSRGNLADLLAVRGNLDEALGHAQRNYELTERLGDVFTRTWALVNLSLVRSKKGDGAGAVDAIERANRIYDEAMDNGGEAEAWRGMVLARALLCIGRIDEARDAAEQSSRMAREREMFLTLPISLRTLAEAQIAAGDPRAIETLGEGAKVSAELGLSYEAEQAEQLRSSARV